MIHQSLDLSPELNPSLKFAPWITKILNEQDQTKPLYCIEINAFVKSTEDNPKPGNINGGKKNSAFGVDGAYWLTIKATLATISTLIHQGYCLRLGVKNGGTDYRTHFSHADFVYLDVDDSATIQESAQRYASVACLIYATPSFTPENQKHRILVRLSNRCVDPDECGAILQWLIQQNPALDQACTDPSRVMFGSLQDEPFFYDENNTLELSSLRADPVYQQILQGIKNPVSATPQETPQGLPYWLKELVSTQDLNQFCKKIGLDYDFQFKQITPDSGESLKWNGFNPFSSTNSSGTSLVVSLKNNQLIVSDRSHSEGTNFINFYYSVINDYSTLATRISDDDFHATLNTIKSFFTNPYRSYDELYYAPDSNKPEKKKLYDIQKILDEIIYPEMRGYFYRFPIRDEGTITGRVFYSYQESGWKREASPEALKLKILETFAKLFGDTAPASISNLLSNNVLLKLPLYISDENKLEPTQDLDHTFFSNGAYNHKDRVLLPLSEKLWYFKLLPYPYQPVSNYAVKRLVKALIKSGVSIDDRKIILRQFVLNMQNKGHLTLKMLYLFGLSTTGKSSVAGIFAKALDCEINSADDVSNNLDHLGSVFESVTVLDDVTSLSKVISTLMVMVRKATDKGVSYRVCNKYIKAHQKVAPVSIILTAETMTIGTNSSIQGGFANRIITCEFLNKLLHSESPWKDFHTNNELIYDLARWAVQQDVKRSSKRLAWLHSLSEWHPVQQERLKNLLETTNPIFTFLAHIVPVEGWIKDQKMYLESTHKGYTMEEIVFHYIAITNDPDMRASNKIASFKQSFNSKVKVYAPNAEYEQVRLKDGAKGRVRKWFGFDIIPGENIN